MNRCSRGSRRARMVCSPSAALPPSLEGSRQRSARPASPSPKVMVAMEMEHTAAKDSKIEFTAANYDVHTSSAKEYAFVAKPDQLPEPYHSFCKSVPWSMVY